MFHAASYALESLCFTVYLESTMRKFLGAALQLIATTTSTNEGTLLDQDSDQDLIAEIRSALIH